MNIEGWTTRQRVLACLTGSNEHSRSAIAPTRWTREGISERLEVDQSVVSRHLKSLIDEGLIVYELRRVHGLKRRRKIPLLSKLGEKRLLDVRTILLSITVEFELRSGRVERRALGTLNHLWPDLSIVDTLGLVEWYERVRQPIPLNSGPNAETTGRLDETMVHWVMEGADTRDNAIERAALLLTRNLSVSALLRWQLELLASEGQADSWKPGAMQGIGREVTEFLLACDWQNVPTGWSPTLDAANRLLIGIANRRDLKLVSLAVKNGAPDEWNVLIGEIDISQ